MFGFAREQAKRDEEVGRLKAQLKSLREMLRESHKVLKHLLQQEGLLKAELRTAQRQAERADSLHSGSNGEILKNVLGSFLLKVYGDAENEEHIRAMAADLPTAGTRHVGEVWVSIDDDGDGIYDRAEQRVAVPHLWSASLTYLSAMAVSQPELFEPVEGDIVTPVCISGEEPLDTRDVKPCSDGCQESYTGRPNPSGTSLLLLLALLLRRPRRRQPAKG